MSKDKFSDQSEIYKKNRPTYPTELFDLILKSTKNRDVVWDCATGNGQVAIALANSFTKVIATDLSENQLKYADKKDNIVYSVMHAETTTFEDDKFDLITVGQAMHWFDFDAFNKEAARVLKPDGTICVWGYGPLGMEGEVGELIKKFYKDIIGPYWDSERNHIDEAYKNVTFNFKNVEIHNNFIIEANWTIDQLKGYFNSWSSVQNYITKNNYNPVNDIILEIKKVWKVEKYNNAVLPIFLKIGKLV